MIRQSWWKILSFVLLMYTCIWGFLVPIPVLDGRLQQSSSQSFLSCTDVVCDDDTVYSICDLCNKIFKSQNPAYDSYSVEYARTGIVFGILGFITGAIWANYQWGEPWSGDPKQNGAAIALLIYLAYFVLRGSMTDVDKRSSISAVYNIFAYAMLFPTIWILPRMTESLHPGGMGSEGNPGLNPNDTSPEMEMVFFPAIIGWILLGVWITTLRIRLRIINRKEICT